MKKFCSCSFVRINNSKRFVTEVSHRKLSVVYYHHLSVHNYECGICRTAHDTFFHVRRLSGDLWDSG